MLTSDTIAAISSAPGGALRGIVRLSGQDAWKHAFSVLAQPPVEPLPGHAYQVALASPPLPLELLLFRGPHSFTGEDIAELQLPGSPALLRMVMDDLLHAGARQAGPGEFTARAFFHGKIDLTEAEGIAATIAAANDRQLRAATTLRDGALHQWITKKAEAIADILALMEAGIDFTDQEGVSFISGDQVRHRLRDIIMDIRVAPQQAIRWDQLDAHPTVVLTGRPNVGKSSLVNALLGQDRALVSPVAGTTRDALSALLPTSGGLIRLVDVAGVDRDQQELSAKMNQARARALRQADLILLVVDPWDDDATVSADLDGLTHPSPTLRICVITNKADIAPTHIPHNGRLLVSAKTGQSLSELKELIVGEVMAAETTRGHLLPLNQRHRKLLREAIVPLERVAFEASNENLERHPELLAADLRHALDLLGEISGAISPDDVLGRIFSSFCIGK